jgi:hypothetical protein
MDEEHKAIESEPNIGELDNSSTCMSALSFRGCHFGRPHKEVMPIERIGFCGVRSRPAHDVALRPSISCR